MTAPTQATQSDEDRAREIAHRILFGCAAKRVVDEDDDSGPWLINIVQIAREIEPALSQARLAAAKEMRERCRAIVSSHKIPYFGEWNENEIKVAIAMHKLTIMTICEALDALAALPLSPEKGSGG